MHVWTFTLSQSSEHDLANNNKIVCQLQGWTREKESATEDKSERINIIVDGSCKVMCLIWKFNRWNIRHEEAELLKRDWKSNLLGWKEQIYLGQCLNFINDFWAFMRKQFGQAEKNSK